MNQQGAWILAQSCNSSACRSGSSSSCPTPAAIGTSPERTLTRGEGQSTDWRIGLAATAFSWDASRQCCHSFPLKFGLNFKMLNLHQWKHQNYVKFDRALKLIDLSRSEMGALEKRTRRSGSLRSRLTGTTLRQTKTTTFGFNSTTATRTRGSCTRGSRDLIPPLCNLHAEWGSLRHYKW